MTTDAATVTARNLGYNGALNAGASATFGFISSGTSGTPALTCTAT